MDRRRIPHGEYLLRHAVSRPRPGPRGDEQVAVRQCGTAPRPTGISGRYAFNLTHYIAQQTEDDLSWQIVNLDVPGESLHDSPILYLAGDEALNLGKESEDKLRAFVEEGGTIVGNADCRSRSSDTGFRNLGRKLFPLYEFKKIARDNVLLHKPFVVHKIPDVSVLSNWCDLMYCFPATRRNTGRPGPSAVKKGNSSSRPISTCR